MIRVKDILKLLPQGEYVELIENNDEDSIYNGVKEEVLTYISECEVVKIHSNYELGLTINYKIEKW